MWYCPALLKRIQTDSTSVQPTNQDAEGSYPSRSTSKI